VFKNLGRHLYLPTVLRDELCSSGNNVYFQYFPYCAVIIYFATLGRYSFPLLLVKAMLVSETA
jgi:hypothetical protein